MPFIFAILFAVAIWFFDMWPFYSGHFRPLIREYDYNVNFYYADNTLEQIGLVSGIDACRFRASEHARHKNITETNWTFRCCRVVRDNPCAITEQ